MHSLADNLPSAPMTARMRHDEKYGSTRFSPGLSGVFTCRHPLVIAQYVSSASLNVLLEKT